MKYVNGKKAEGEAETSLNIGDKYTDGFEIVGDVGRKRIKELEIGGSFLPNSTKSTWEKMFKSPESVRTYVSSKQISRLPSAKLYPKSLKETKY